MGDYLPQDPSSPEDYERKIESWDKVITKHLRYLWEHQGADFFDLTLITQRVLSEVLTWENQRREDEAEAESDLEDDDDE